jgi:hypothetical protein
MPCFTAKVTFGTAIAAMGGGAVAVVAGAETVVGAAAGWAAFVAACGGVIAAGMALADCLQDNGRQQDAETLRREMDTLKRHVDQIGQLVPGAGGAPGG